MGRRRTVNRDLPPQMQRKGRRYYYGRTWIPLGADLQIALKEWARLHGESVTEDPVTFADAARRYRLSGEFSSKATKTQSEYSRQLATLCKVFGHLALSSITPHHVKRYMALRPKIAGTREKALLSLVFNFARGDGLTDSPNPCAGLRGKKSRRRRYVTDAELGAILPHADQPTRDFIELAYRTGQDASIVLKMKRTDVQNETLAVRRQKTGEAVRIEIVGPLAKLIDRLVSYPVASVYLVRDERGQPFTLQAIRRRFWLARDAAGADWQIRDLRAKAGTDLEDNEEANRLLAHAAMTTTDDYIRRNAGRKAKPPMREIAEEAAILRKK